MLSYQMNSSTTVKILTVDLKKSFWLKWDNHTISFAMALGSSLVPNPNVCTVVTLIFEPSRGKTNNVVSDQV